MGWPIPLPSASACEPMDSEALVQRANAVGRFFEAMPDRQEAIDGVAAHFRRYWAPSLREQLLAQVHVQAQVRAQAQVQVSDWAEPLHPLVMDALLGSPDFHSRHPPTPGSMA